MVIVFNSGKQSNLAALYKRFQTIICQGLFLSIIDIVFSITRMRLSPLPNSNHTTDHPNTSKQGSSKNSSISQGKVHLKFTYRDFDVSTLQKALNIQTFGVQVVVHQKYKDQKYLNLGQFTLCGDPDSFENILAIPQKSSKAIKVVPYLCIFVITSYIFPIPNAFAKSKLDCLLLLKIKDSEGFTEYILEFENTGSRDLYQQAIQHILILRTYELQFNNQQQFYEFQIQSIIDECDYKDNLTAFNVQSILKILDFNISVENIYDIFFQEKQEITIEELTSRIPILLRRKEIQPIFNEYCVNAKRVTDQSIGCMTIDEFRTFLDLEQGLQLSDAALDEIVLSMNDQLVDRSYNLLSFQQFSDYLTNPLNTIEDLSKLEAGQQDMDQPLNHYHISSSRQTLQIDESLYQFHCMKKYHRPSFMQAPLIFAFERGSRAIEISLWDGSDGFPVCFYGPMMNFSAKLDDLFKTINKFAFTNSPYPLIVRFEDHCSKAQKALIPEIVKRILGDKVMYLEKSPTLRSPNEMRGKVILCQQMVHRQIDDLEDMIAQDADEERSYSRSKKKNLSQMMMNNELYTHVKLKRSLDMQDNRPQMDLTQRLAVSVESSVFEPVQQLLNREYYLNDLIQVGQTFMDSPNSIYQVTDWVELMGLKRGSSSENHSQRLNEIQEHIHDPVLTEMHENILKKARQGKMIRYIPNCKVTDCKNSYASQGFLSDCSFIMVHHHIIDYSYMYHYAMFKQNGGFNGGYILKQIYSGQLSQPKKVQFRVISGSHLGDTKRHQQEGTSPLVQVLLREPVHGQEDKVQQYCSSIIKNNSYNPQFNLTCQFEVKNPSLAVLMVCIYNQSLNHLISWNAYPVTVLRQGYRVMPLVDEFLNPIPGTLFCQFL